MSQIVSGKLICEVEDGAKEYYVIGQDGQRYFLCPWAYLYHVNLIKAYEILTSRHKVKMEYELEEDEYNGLKYKKVISVKIS